jgi:hypothetical protein
MKHLSIHKFLTSSSIGNLFYNNKPIITIIYNNLFYNVIFFKLYYYNIY